MSRTNIDLNDKLVEEALELTKMKTKKEVVNYALSDLVRKKKRKEILRLMGSRCWKGNLDLLRRTRFDSY